jgi:hypothetical protein
VHGILCSSIQSPKSHGLKNCTQYCTQKLVLQKLYTVLYTKTSTTELDRGILGTTESKNTAEFLEWIFQTAGFWFRSAPKIPRLYGTVVLVFVYNTVRSMFKHRTHHMSALQLHGKRHRRQLNIIMTTVKVCSLRAFLDAIV